MILNHEIPRNDATRPLGSGNKCEGVGLSSQEPGQLIQVVLQVGTKSNGRSGGIVTLSNEAAVRGDQRLLQVIIVHRGIPKGTHGDGAGLSDCDLGNILPSEGQGAILLVARCELGYTSTSPVCWIGWDDGEELPQVGLGCNVLRHRPH